MKKRQYEIIILVGLIAPLSAFAVDFQSMLGTIVNLLNIFTTVLLVLATVVIAWGAAMRLWPQNEDMSTRGVALMAWGSVLFFIMVACWGIALLLINTFDVGGQGIPSAIGGL